MTRTASNLGVRFELSLKRLQATGRFNQEQLRLVEEEFQRLWDCDDSLHHSFDHISSIKPGEQIDRYCIEELLGCGGEAHVFRARELGSGRIVAIKILHNTRTSERFHREMNLVQQLAHPNIVTAYEVGEFHSMPFIAMELMRGPDLNALVLVKGPIDWRQSSAYILQIARALDHAHCRDLIHRDIKPGNIIFNGDDQVKLVDLGLASMAMPTQDDEPQSLHLTRETQIAGTLPYMAPEQAKSLSRADVRSDIYSLGATWFYLLTGKTRVPGKTFSRQYKNLVTKRKFRRYPPECLPECLSRILDRMVAYDRGLRYQDCAQLAQDLGQSLSDLGQNVTSAQLRVLIVEDSQSDMFLAIELLRMANDSLLIHQATTLAEGMAIHEEKRVDLVFLDLTLPDSSGVETVTRFRTQWPLCRSSCYRERRTMKSQRHVSRRAPMSLSRRWI
ncbi:MAG: protein kinase [Planctomycetales bacterium]|nr:protein kinase [Planctomycetales bacterium]